MKARTLRKAIEQVFQEWERFPGPLSHFTMVGVRDRANDRYLLQMLNSPHGIQYSRTLAHLEVRDGKIYIEADGTEEGIATDLMRYGVPEDRIVLAFYPVEMREMGEFAVH
jgi:hypothetical protein